MEKQESSRTLDTINLNESSNNVAEESGDTSPFYESNLDLFSHDSTHVRLVIEAERQTSLAREKAASILQKISVDADDSKRERQTSGETAAAVRDVEKDERDDEADNNNNEPNFDNLRIQADLDHVHRDDSSFTKEGRVTDSKVFEQFEGTTKDDIEHLKRCIQPLSPSAKHKKRISGKFEFKRMNSVLTVVKSMDEDSNQSYSGSVGSKKSKSSKSSKKSRVTIKSKGSFGSKKTLNSFTQSNALTDDAWVQELAVKETKKMKKKKKKAGDLPPRSSHRRSYAGSMGVAASEADREDIISVISNLSELSNESITHKARDNSPLVVTDVSQLQPRIPDTICLKTQQKMTRMALLKRKLSFNRGKATF